MQGHETRQTWFRLALLLAIGSALVTPLYAYRLPDSCLAWPVLLDNNPSGLYLQHRQSIYFVTAWHTLFDPEDARLRRSRITLRSYAQDRSILDPIVFELDLATLDKSHRILTSRTDDVAVVRIGDVTDREDNTVRWTGAPGVVAQAQPGPAQLVLGADEWNRFNQTQVSDDVFIFAQRPERGRPFVRKGALAGKDLEARRLIVDALVPPGSSGGPVIEIQEVGPRRWEPKLIGIVVESIPYRAEDTSENTAFVDNSGYAVVTPVDSILDLIEKDPSAPSPAP